MISIYIIITCPPDLSSFFSIYFIQNLGGFNVEYIVFGIIVIVVGGLAGYELIEGIVAGIKLDGDDEEIFAPIAIFSLLAFLAGLSYFG